jgi:hypothetical protein
MRPEVAPTYTFMDDAGRRTKRTVAEVAVVALLDEETGKPITWFVDGAAMRAYLPRGGEDEGVVEPTWWAEWPGQAFVFAIDGWPGERGPKRDEMPWPDLADWWPVVQQVFARRDWLEQIRKAFAERSE